MTPDFETLPILIAVDANYCGFIMTAMISEECTGVSVLTDECGRAGFIVTGMFSSAPCDITSLIIRARHERLA